MATVLSGRISRRDFVKGGLAAFGTVAAFGTYSSLGSCVGPEEKSPMRWALLSDTHIPEDVGNNYRGFFPYKNLGNISLKCHVFQG